MIAKLIIPILFSLIQIDLVEATVYNACATQTNADYLTTADNSKIDLSMVNELRWLAMSRDMLNRWGGNYNYKDNVLVLSKDFRINGFWSVRDCMNERFSSRVDFLQCQHTGIYDKWDIVIIIKFSKK